MSDYLGNLAQRAATTPRQVVPRVGALYEPTLPGLRMPTVFARDEATEPNAESGSPQPTSVRDRLQELQSTLKAASTAQPEFSADAQIVALRQSQLPMPAAALAPSARTEITAHQPPSQVRSTDFGDAPPAPLIRYGSRGPITEHEASGPHAPRERNPESHSRPVAIRPVFAAADRSQPAQVTRAVRIEIGRIEIRATTPASRTTTASRPAARQKQSLEEYLQQRSRPTR